jgi:predicted RNA-binding Zn-ribbon protein involved in translation (DUF1610 family)
MKPVILDLNITSKDKPNRTFGSILGIVLDSPLIYCPTCGRAMKHQQAMVRPWQTFYRCKRHPEVIWRVVDPAAPKNI